MPVDEKIHSNEWLTLLQQRDIRSFNWLYDKHSGALLGVIKNIVKDSAIAENLMQDTFIKIWNNVESYDLERGSFFTWIFNIARNTALDFLRSKAHHQSLKNKDFVIAELENKFQTQQNINTIGIQDLVGNLDSKHRDLINLIYFNGYTQEEVSKTLDIPLGTVKTRVKKAMTELRKML